MKAPLSKSESVLAFLRFHGWELEEKNHAFYVLKPPAEIEPATFRIEIPYPEYEPGADVMMDVLVENLARMYHWNEWALLHFLSKTPQEIETVMRQSAEKSLAAAPPKRRKAAMLAS